MAYSMTKEQYKFALWNGAPEDYVFEELDPEVQRQAIAELRTERNIAAQGAFAREVTFEPVLEEAPEPEAEPEATPEPDDQPRKRGRGGRFTKRAEEPEPALD